MAIQVLQIHHVQITIPASVEDACRRFYGELLGLEEIDKPPILRKNGGMWYRQAGLELHISPEPAAAENQKSKRHICFLVRDLAATERRLAEAGIEIIPDRQPIEGWIRFYVRDPGGNRVEMAQLV